MLKEFFEKNPEVAVAFSGGVDSAYLLYQAAKYAEKTVAYCVDPGYMLEEDRLAVTGLADSLGVKLRIVLFEMYRDESIAANTEQRCYFCKNRMMETIISRAAADGLTVVADGSNADDDPALRPGMKALEELGIQSPLRQAGLSKADIRRLSREAGLPTWDMPSYSCAATRVPTGVKLTKELLLKIARGEQALKELGFSDMRLRWRDGAAKLELRSEQMAAAVEKREEILEALGSEFTEISLDLKGR